ncbi:MAG TPA: rod shape-determining protein MreD [Stellaceae bacterium]|nr:rod shape-determining protein MreD [Stellaceae bacterium]
MFKKSDTQAVPQAENVLIRLLPVATTAAAALLSIQPVHLPGYAALAPAFTLMAVYHWTIYRPDLLPPFALFLVGAAHDLLAGGQPGVTPLLLLLARAAVLRYRRWFPDRDFPFVWAGFTLLTVAAMAGLWLLDSLLEARLVAFRGGIFRAVLTISLFPVASFLLGRTQRALMAAD